VKAARRRWVGAPTDAKLSKEIAAGCGVSPVTAQILVNRGVRDPEDAARFLKPSLSDLKDPALLADISPAADRIRRASGEKQSILIFGDYDVDGVTSSALVHRLLRLCGTDSDIYLPSRTVEGYGLSEVAVREIIARKPDLVVTVDCGVSAEEEVRALGAAGIDVIVTDHHPPGETLPDAVAVVDPKRKDCTYPFEELAGVGVAFKLAWEIARRFSQAKKVSPELRRFLVDSLGLVALGTVADVVPLVGENRVLVNSGLGVLASGTHVGIDALAGVARLKGSMTATDVAFRLGPRMNAAGRMGSADDALRLLLEEDPSRAKEIATRLDRANRERQRLEDRILRSASPLPEVSDESKASIVAGSDDWHEGVLGIVASRLAERTGRPTALVAFRGDEGKGSARSVPGVDLGRALAECRGTLIRCGGHAAAAGLRVERARLDEFRAEFESAVRRQLDGGLPEPVLRFDAEVAPGDLSLGLAEEIDLLRPFGHGNRKPVFSARGMELGGDLRPLGAGGKHLAFDALVRSAKGRGRKLRAVAFNFADRRRELEDNAWCPVDIAFELSQSVWSGPEGFELCVKDIRPAAKRAARPA
jgi:single-stranded-DNA-specific exonuclease